MRASEGRIEPGTVVRVPFPYADARTAQHRPALVVAATGPATDPDRAPLLLWVLMITSAENRGWPGDVAIRDLEGAGLPAPSIVRTAKIATVDLVRAEPRGRLATADLKAVGAEVTRHLGAVWSPRS